MKTLKTFSKKNNVKVLNTKQTTKINGGGDSTLGVIPWVKRLEVVPAD